ncbi:TetR/AcrR family transcriptional regulator [Streptomyces eurocidicus]|uniref:AcrR family transcriptional regulator n=1 Tax=Streptomyces eurocidicus TaxID=66423 RepID=A0A7W8BA00_STREU|nr:TetR family transcriptional regulator [Streptomyces eurocidicus]MBB5119526.1 AcrR family transcriptional regulator [Streptomyces eurocidicus]MBF6050563.1 TetR family transcriptional regulator [Streptomyces eurocidicus]
MTPAARTDTAPAPRARTSPRATTPRATTPPATPPPTSAPPATTPPSTAGLRERKRERTRRSIAQAAFRLFAEDGFDAVTLTRIAAAAEVAPATVFTHYASKEDIFFGRRDEFEPKVTEAVTGAATGAELLERLGQAYAAAFDIALDEDALDQARVFSRVLLDSAALRRSYHPVAHRRRLLLERLLLERSGARGADPAVRAELEAFAALANTARELGFEALHASLAAGEPADRVREAAGAALARGYGRVVRAYGGAGVLDAGVLDAGVLDAG